jgi:hypothetical protein
VRAPSLGRPAHRHLDICRALQALAEIALSRNELAVAAAHAEEVVATARDYGHAPFYAHAVLTLAHIDQARGNHDAALARCAALIGQRPQATLPAEQQLEARIAREHAAIALAARTLGLGSEPRDAVNLT